MKIIVVLAAAAIATAAPVVHAAEITHAEARFGYERSDLNGLDFDGWNIAGDATVALNDSFGLNFGIARGNPDGLAGFVDSLTRLSFGGYYDVNETTYIGAYVDSTYVAGGFSDWSYVYGVEGGVEVNNIEASAFFGQGDYDSLGAPSKSLVYGVDVVYALNSAFDFGAFYMREDMDASNAMSQYGVTFGYQVSPGGSSVPLYLSTYLARLDGTFDNANQFGLTLSVPLQGETKRGRKTFSRTSVFHNAWSGVGALF